MCIKYEQIKSSTRKEVGFTKLNSVLPFLNKQYSDNIFAAYAFRGLDKKNIVIISTRKNDPRINCVKEFHMVTDIKAVKKQLDDNQYIEGSLVIPHFGVCSIELKAPLPKYEVVEIIKDHAVSALLIQLLFYKPKIPKLLIGVYTPGFPTWQIAEINAKGKIVSIKDYNIEGSNALCNLSG